MIIISHTRVSGERENLQAVHQTRFHLTIIFPLLLLETSDLMIKNIYIPFRTSFVSKQNMLLIDRLRTKARNIISNLPFSEGFEDNPSLESIPSNSFIS